MIPLYSLYTDAATQPQSGLSAGGILLIHNHQQVQHGVALTATTTVLFYTDSQIVSQSLEKRYAKHYQAQVDALLAAQQPFQLVLTQWVPEKQNMGAHTLANQALHAREDVK
ncbi:reverse transcriptase-like protein [Levilactobacillus zymae]|uniref:reverse transcriptase-like protein n=1 Tax=Levilactobacillus zymae TaxID=267363 RepID=UPI003FCD9688